MDDHKIIELYWNRDETAIRVSDEKYGHYCRTIAQNILDSAEDSAECVNDTWHNAWKAIPPQKPEKLRHFFGCITRRLAIDRYGYNHAQKRNAHVEAVMDEYAECIPSGSAPIEDEVVLKDLINTFLASLNKQTRIIFLRRYWYACSVGEIASSMQLTESYVSVILHRTRIGFKEFLEKEGLSV